jgi:enolase-phosphatase E1
MIRAVLCDIEGTTTSIAFAHKVLFPLSLQRMDAFVRQNWGTGLIAEEIDAVRKEISKSPEKVTQEEVIYTLKSWIEADKKITPLKSIQGKIWKEAFESGQIKGHIYPDVPDYFRIWDRLGLKIAIFSSGSVEAQKLIFRYSEKGDLTSYISAYFDTTTGPKRESISYKRIAQNLALEPSQVLFVSDTPEELDAAQSAGMQTVWMLRNGEVVQKNLHNTATSFAEIEISPS